MAYAGVWLSLIGILLLHMTREALPWQVSSSWRVIAQQVGFLLGILALLAGYGVGWSL